MSHIYFDYASTTPVDPMVVKAMQPYFFERFGNAVSPHALGQQAAKALEESREVVARFIGARPEDIVFNSGATEGNNHAILGLAEQAAEAKNHIIVSMIEHHSVLEPAQYLEKKGFRVTYVCVDKEGRVNPRDIEEAITPQTMLIAVMQASNEIGTLQPLNEIGVLARKAGVPFLVDAAQTVGHVPVDVDVIGCDLLTCSAHKCYGPKGVGALFIRKGTRLGKTLMGGGQERNRRASTQNVAGAVGFAKALELSQEHMSAEEKHHTALRERLLQEIPRMITGTRVNGSRTSRLPHNAHFSFEGVKGESLLMGLDMAGICASMGSACTSGSVEPSHVLKAIGLSDELAFGSLRLTLGRWTTEAHVERLLEKLPGVVLGLRKSG